MRRTAPVALVVVLAALAAAPAVHAQDEPAPTGRAAPSATERAEARRRFRRGVELIQRERWQDAIPELEAARNISPTPSVLFNLGLALRAVGRSREAMASFRDFLRLGGAQ